MPYTQTDHPIMWEVSHHPIIALVLALGFGVLFAWLVIWGCKPGPAALTDFNFAASTNTTPIRKDSRRGAVPMSRRLFARPLCRYRV